MATRKQLAANRRIAQLSIGPKTAEGKAAVRLNTDRHARRRETWVFKGSAPGI